MTQAGAADCEFCGFFAWSERHRILAFEDERFAVLIGRKQSTGPGYAIVIPRAHIAGLHDLPTEAAEPLVVLLQRVSAAIVQAFPAEATTILINNGRPAQHVMHLHVHVVPRSEGDGYPAAPGVVLPDEELARQAELLRRHLA